MKICQITYTGFGGLSRVVFSLISADKECEHDWSIGFIGDQPIDPSYPILCEQHSVKYAVFRSVSGRPFRAWWSLFFWLKKIEPKVVICHSITSIIACYLYTWLSGSKLIVVEHTSNQVKTNNEQLASKLAMLLADTIVLFTHRYMAELRELHGLIYCEKKVKLIPNGVDTAIFKPRLNLLQQPIRPIRLGMAARFTFSKRQDLLVEVMLLLAKRRPDLLFELHLAGDGEQIECVKTLVTNSYIAPHIRFDGVLTEVQMAEWLKGLDIYLHATDAESFCMSVLEAMACGLPVVASSNVGIAVLNSDDSVGILVENNPNLWAEKIEILAENDVLREKMGLLAREKAVNCYSSEACLKKYLQVIQN